MKKDYNRCCYSPFPLKSVFYITACLPSSDCWEIAIKSGIGKLEIKGSMVLFRHPISNLRQTICDKIRNGAVDDHASKELEQIRKQRKA